MGFRATWLGFYFANCLGVFNHTAHPLDVESVRCGSVLACKTEQSSATGGWTDEPLHLLVLPQRCHRNETFIPTLTYVCIHHMHAASKYPGLYTVGEPVLYKSTSPGA